MAVIRYGPIVDLVAGSIGGTTFGETTSGPTTRRRAGPPNPATSRQLAARSAQSAAAKLWGTLTNLQRAAWDTAAELLVLANAVGNKYTRTGYALFTQINATLSAAGVAMITTAPATTEPDQLTAVAITPTLSGEATTALSATWNGGTPTTSAVILRTGPISGAGTTPPRAWLKTVIVFPPSTAPPQDVTAEWIATWGDLPTQKAYKLLAQFRPLNTTTGVTGCPAFSTLSVAGTIEQLTDPVTVLSIDTTSGPAAGGTLVKITGTNFTRRTVVYFGDVPTLLSTTTSTTSITATTPATTAGTVPVTVRSPEGCSGADGAPTFTFIT